MILPERILHCQCKPGEHGHFGVVIGRLSVYPFVLVIVIVLGIPSVFEDEDKEDENDPAQTMFKNFPKARGQDLEVLVAHSTVESPPSPC